jgi:hypothetical protein
MSGSAFILFCVFVAWVVKKFLESLVELFLDSIPRPVRVGIATLYELRKRTQQIDSPV